VFHKIQLIIPISISINYLNPYKSMKKPYLLKILIMLKLCVLLITTSILTSYAGTSYAQKVRISLNLKNVPLIDVINAIKQQTQFEFSYDASLETVILKKVTIKEQDKDIATILDLILKGTGIHYMVTDRIILLSNNIIKSTSDAGNSSFVQEEKVTGRVTDDVTGEALPGVNILIAGTTIGTTTDKDGRYSISVPAADAKLIFSFIGYVTEEIIFSGQKTIDLKLIPEIKGLDEVIVVAYGSTTQRTSTGALQTVQSKELKELPVAQFTQKLQGKFAGVRINQGTGRPGEPLNVQIRGAASLSTASGPLYVVDGFPIVGDISNINPDEIETITVLKDAASTTLYGSRAAFGVVLITTKSAKSGKTSITFDAYTGFQKVPKKGRPDLMNGTEWAQFKKESYEDLGQPVPAAFQNPEQYGEGYDWYDAMLRTGQISNYTLSINTSKDKFSSSVVAGYFNQKGVLLNSDYKRFSLRANNQFKLADQLRAGFNLAPTYSYGNSPTTDGQFFSSGGLLLNATLTPPVVPYQNADGTYPVAVTTPGVTTFPTPNWVRSIKETKNLITNNRLLSNAYLEFEPISRLILKSSINIDLGQKNTNYFLPSTAGRAFAAAPSKLNANLFEGNERYWSWLSESTISYSKQFGEHNFDLLGGYTVQKYRWDYSGLSGSNFPDDRVQTINAALVKNNPDMRIEEWSLLSYLARLNYNLMGKYFLGASIRSDGSSRFGSENKWGVFPAISAGWLISEESFLRDLNHLSLLKIRGSYGVTGNNNIGNYTQYNTVASSNVVFNNTTASGISVSNLGNSQLGWENTKQLDLGLDLSILNNRVSFTYDYYNKVTDNLLYTLAVPSESGFNAFTGNVGEVKFWGHEFSVNSNNLVGAFKWNTSFNISFSDNKVIALSTLSDSLIVSQGFVTTLTRVGGRIGQFYGMVQEGVYADQSDFDSSPKAVDSQVGAIKFRDVNGDGVITYGNNGGDRTVIGNPFPKFIYGFTNNFSYKNFDLTVVVAGSHGNKIATVTEQGTTNLDGVFNVLKEVKDRWRSESDPGAGLYGKTTGSTGRERDEFHTRFVKNGSYLTVKNITLGYNLPLQSLKFINSMRVYASVQQALVFTKYKYGNPEVGVDFNGNQPGSTSQGIDYSAYPVPRTFTFGVNLNLQ
jgi:TonB-dependent starch-binding outer membrane protein SusC